jgi:hypothetical protein
MAAPLDPRVTLDTTISSTWHRHVWRYVQTSEDDSTGLATERTDMVQLHTILATGADSMGASH